MIVRTYINRAEAIFMQITERSQKCQVLFKTSLLVGLAFEKSTSQRLPSTWAWFLSNSFNVGRAWKAEAHTSIPVKTHCCETQHIVIKKTQRIMWPVLMKGNAFPASYSDNIDLEISYFCQITIWVWTCLRVWLSSSFFTFHIRTCVHTGQKYFCKYLDLSPTLINTASKSRTRLSVAKW